MENIWVKEGRGREGSNERKSWNHNVKEKSE
jgi:hypothetical protein